MAKHKEEKTNVMRTLEQKKIPYTPHTYDPNGPIDGVSVAQALGQDPACVFKTLVTRGASGGYYVFDIPVAENLDLKKAARAVGEKSVAMLPQKELLPLTGYVHGGCSPVGMKNPSPRCSTGRRQTFPPSWCRRAASATRSSVTPRPCCPCCGPKRRILLWTKDERPCKIIFSSRAPGRTT